jgi:ubiquinone/menaquinone biosynthesis C-methylase UbiE
MGIKSRLKNIAKSVLNESTSKTIAEADKSNTEHWTDHNVTFHKDFKTKEASLNFINWRNSIYLFYDQLMPCSGFDGQIIVDYGCGPGHDTVGFVEYSKPKKVYAVDISTSSLGESKERMKLHTNDTNLVEFVLIKDGSANLPIEDGSVDYVHSSGVLHHTPNETEILKDLYRILKKGGKARIMMYNYYSIYAQLQVGYNLRVKRGIHKDVPFSEALRRESDMNAPIARYYKKEEFIKICEDIGFKASLKGVAINVEEMGLCNLRFEALGDTRTPAEIRDFLYGLSFDEYQRPLYKGNVAGIDAVYELTK